MRLNLILTMRLYYCMRLYYSSLLIPSLISPTSSMLKCLLSMRHFRFPSSLGPLYVWFTWTLLPSWPSDLYSVFRPQLKYHFLMIPCSRMHPPLQNPIFLITLTCLIYLPSRLWALLRQGPCISNMWLELCLSRENFNK